MLVPCQNEGSQTSSLDPGCPTRELSTLSPRKEKGKEIKIIVLNSNSLFCVHDMLPSQLDPHPTYIHPSIDASISLRLISSSLAFFLFISLILPLPLPPPSPSPPPPSSFSKGSQIMRISRISCTSSTLQPDINSTLTISSFIMDIDADTVVLVPSHPARPNPDPVQSQQ